MYIIYIYIYIIDYIWERHASHLVPRLSPGPLGTAASPIGCRKHSPRGRQKTSAPLGVIFPQTSGDSTDQWEFQDPKVEVLYHIRPYFVGIFPYIGRIYGGHLSVITGYKWDYTFYEWGFLSTYNWYLGP